MEMPNLREKMQDNIGKARRGRKLRDREKEAKVREEKRRTKRVIKKKTGRGEGRIKDVTWL